MTQARQAGGYRLADTPVPRIPGLISSRLPSILVSPRGSLSRVDNATSHHQTHPETMDSFAVVVSSSVCKAPLSPCSERLLELPAGRRDFGPAPRTIPDPQASRAGNARARRTKQLYKTPVTCENAETKRRSGFYTRLSDDDVTPTDEMTSLVGLSRLQQFAEELISRKATPFLHPCRQPNARRLRFRKNGGSVVSRNALVNAFLHWCASGPMRSAHEAMRRTRTSATNPEQAHSKPYHPKSGVVRPTPQTQAA